MIVTKQNFRYIAGAIKNVVGDQTVNVAYEVDPDDNLIITVPQNVDVNSVEAEIANVKTVFDLTELRKERNKLLTECDWTQFPDVPESTRTLWQPYRQALRDITNTYSSLDDVVWPDAP